MLSEHQPMRTSLYDSERFALQARSSIRLPARAPLNPGHLYKIAAERPGSLYIYPVPCRYNRELDAKQRLMPTPQGSERSEAYTSDGERQVAV